MRLGILGTSEIAFRRFMPALVKSKLFEFAGIASRDIAKTSRFTDTFGGKGYDGYASLLNDDSIDCVYVPLPPALHFEWAKKAMENGKHIMLEKPFTTSLADTKKLLEIAQEHCLAVHENYMFKFHSQIDYILNEIKKGIIGEIRLIRIDFGFPFKGANDFRYSKALGGGALLDCGGYPINLASVFLGEGAHIVTSSLSSSQGVEVDTFGSAVMANHAGQIVQLSFGMDNAYRCSIDIWGSKGSLFSGRILTAPDGFEPTLTITTAEGVKDIKMPADDAFGKSIAFFHRCIGDASARKQSYAGILKQVELVAQFTEVLI